MKKWDLILIFIILSEYVVCFAIAVHLNIFQFMLVGQVIPTVLLAILGGRIASLSKYKWLIIALVSIIYAVLMFILLNHIPIQIIENNTTQSSTSTFSFSRNIGFGTYFGLFLQQFVITTLITILLSIIKRIQMGKY
ncbi:hypothetical protein [Staphylococcus canis]|uniref:Uncharacterized protein n=1 Tax=Staphylococcus canis TaxID=2724942 RepID=A0ABS0TBY6_9STAP|nr:hypothetical protein [Staphylococcus canis]MBI5975274.1 hypothetical protein [Staphylococcus canis]